MPDVTIHTQPKPITRTMYVAGHTGLVGSALVRHWAGRSDARLVCATRAEVDLTDPHQVDEWLAHTKPDTVVVAAGRVGGILANSRCPADFIYENMMIEANLIHGAWKAGVKRLLNFGSSCMYPKQCPQPMQPEHLMTGPLEPTSEAYAMAKLAGWSLCMSYNRQHRTRFITAIPATVYGPGDSFDLDDAHVLSALIRKFHEAVQQHAPEVTLWGSGQAIREFLFVDDLAEACEVILERYEGDDPVNIGTGQGCTVQELARLIAEVAGFRGTIRWDASRPDGTPVKLLDDSTIRTLGWKPRTDLRSGVERTRQWWLAHRSRE